MVPGPGGGAGRGRHSPGKSTGKSVLLGWAGRVETGWTSVMGSRPPSIQARRHVRAAWGHQAQGRGQREAACEEEVRALGPLPAGGGSRPHSPRETQQMEADRPGWPWSSPGGG